MDTATNSKNAVQQVDEGSHDELTPSNPADAEQVARKQRQVNGCKTNPHQSGKKEFKVKDTPILVINDNGKFYATSGRCPHYDFPLEKGIYSRGKIRCPLHGSCYNVKTGDIEDYPTFGSLHTYDVKEQDGDLIINTTEKQLESTRRTPLCGIKSLS
ncbi:rieske [2Fe-2S] domain protein, partial [Cooperia oncophora]